MRGFPQQGLHTPIKYKSHFPNANTAAVVTLDAEPGHRHVIRKITVSYQGGTPVAANIAVTIAGTEVWGIGLPLADSKGPHDFDFPFGLYDADNLNQAVVVTATDPAEASTVASLSVLYE